MSAGVYWMVVLDGKLYKVVLRLILGGYLDVSKKLRYNMWLLWCL